MAESRTDLLRYVFISIAVGPHAPIRFLLSDNVRQERERERRKSSDGQKEENRKYKRESARDGSEEEKWKRGV